LPVLGRPPIQVTEKPPIPPPAIPPPRGESREYDPLIEGLLQRLPTGGEWKGDARRKWLQAAANIFDMMYTDPDETITVIEVKTSDPKKDGK
jgi:hypothetical protein